MIVAANISERNAIENAAVCIGQPDGSWHVYLIGEDLPPAVEAIIDPVSQPEA